MVLIDDIFWLTGLPLTILLISAAIIYQNETRYIIGQELPLKILRLIRKVYNYPIPIIVSITLVIIGYVELNTDVEPIVSVTLLYATVLFLGNILQTSRPYPILEFSQPYYDSEYADEPGERGFKYHFRLQNVGEKPLLNPKIEYCLFDGKKKRITGWQAVSGTKRQVVKIPYGETKEYDVEHSPITDGEDADFYLAIRVLPQRGYWIHGLWWTKAIGAGTEEPPFESETDQY